ncbi:hypothetical protein J2T17_005455 [Paenibacillus mucilaginosus]|uniref:hypothetical protein n=1 Tax=Paenibacillus mucilaginosus TaxID=61624 RepID=UPI003D1BBAC9
MKHKPWLSLAAGCLLLLMGGRAALSAYEAEPQILPPNGLRIPAAVELLKPTPFYDAADLTSKPLGTLSPQQVDIVGAEATWSSGRSWYKIHTWLGDKWISPEPWTVQIAPPKTILLTGDTPLYPKRTASAVPTASLSAQEVEVVGAEKQWHYMDSHPYEETWLQIRTSWLGDQWIKVPLADIGTVQPVDRKWYYPGVQAFIRPKPHRFPDIIENRTLHVTGEFTTIFDMAYRIDNGKGQEEWVLQKGYGIQETAERMVLRRSVLLLERLGGMSGVRLEPQAVQVFEKIDTNGPERPEYTGSTGVWYHVRSDQGEGWINEKYGDPENIQSARGKLKIGAGGTALYRFPNPDLLLNVDRLGAQTFSPAGYWDDGEGRRWYQADTYAGKVWILFRPEIDVFQPE